eukprot:jgi/Orpsp1_1/1180930/evm.model.c7180000075152.1
MGFIIDCSKMKLKFEKLQNQEYFVDKSNIINIFNNLINKDNSNNVCITKPRRFGKTSIAAMLVTYYSKGIDSKGIFDEYKVSKGIDFQELFDNFKKEEENKKKRKEKYKINKKYEKDEKEIEKEINKKVKEEIEKEKKQYEEFQGKFHTLYFDFSYDVEAHKTLNEYLTSLNSYLKKDIRKVFPNSEILNDYNKKIYINLENLNIETEEQFIIIIDEWDYIISNNLFTPKERKDYLGFLKNLIKDQGYSAFVYMTGILPIAKQLSQSSINCFTEYSMLDDKKYYKYFGFTEQEVHNLCKDDEENYEDLENLYNGYKAFNGEKMFNLLSVVQALTENGIKNYWTQTGRFDELIEVINFNIDGVRNEVLDLIRKKEISIDLTKYGAEDLLKESEKQNNNEMNEKQNYNEMNEKQNNNEMNEKQNNNEMNEKQNNNEMNEKQNNKNKKVLYSKMVTFGFLTYYDGKISIPNEELKENFIEALSKDENTEYYYDLMKISDKMLKATLNKQVKEMCIILEKSHLIKIKPGDKMDHDNLKRVIDYAYFNAWKTYDIDEELGKGKGKLHFIFKPKDKMETLIILELKLNRTAKNALKQIYEDKYYDGLRKEHYKGTYLLVGLNLNTERKEYSCIIDECDCDLKLISTYTYIPPNSEKRTKDDLEFDGIAKRLRKKNVLIDFNEDEQSSAASVEPTPATITEIPTTTNDQENVDCEDEQPSAAKEPTKELAKEQITSAEPTESAKEPAKEPAKEQTTPAEPVEPDTTNDGNNTPAEDDATPSVTCGEETGCC